MVEELLESIEEGDRVDELATGDASSPMYSNLFSTYNISALSTDVIRIGCWTCHKKYQGASGRGGPARVKRETQGEGRDISVAVSSVCALCVRALRFVPQS
eukprot:scaffold37267_cov66-Phaeocystis_antarctica.AAC.2